MKAIKKQTFYDRIPQLGAAAASPKKKTDQPDSKSPFPLTESRRDGSGTNDSLADDDFTDQPPTAAGTNDGRSGALEAKYLEVDDGRDDEDVDLPPSVTNRCRYSRSTAKRILETNLVDDVGLLRAYRRLCRAGDDPHVDDGGLAAVKLFKFWALSIISIAIVQPLARWMEWEVDENYSLQDFVQYDLSVVLLDLLFFFVVGRLHINSCRGIDSLFPWGIFTMLGSIIPSIEADFAFLRHSVSTYDVMCNWPIILFVYASTLLASAIAIVVALLHSHHRRNVLRSRIVEAVSLLCLFILPHAKSDSFHLHHWFGMWWLGMQSNAPEWWARAFQAFALGSYINGIAVWGRDPILGCQYAFYRSTDLSCGYMQCYEASKNDTGAGNETKSYTDFVVPDWRLCNAAELKTSQP